MTSTHTTAEDVHARIRAHKAVAPNSLLGFRCGDFVEWFFEDAATVANTLGIVLTKRGQCRGEPVPMAAVPLMRAQHYVEKLKAAGFDVVIEGHTAAEQQPADLVPFDFDKLSREAKEDYVLQAWAFERKRMRARALHERLAAYGLGREADTLHVAKLANFPREGAELDALESIVSKLERGARLELLPVLQGGTGLEAALRLLSAVQTPDNAAGFGERVAVAVICKADDDAAALRMAGDVLDHTRDALAIAAESLRSRLEVVETAIARLDSVTVAPLQ